MSEWPKEAGCKPAGVAYGGSNPPRPTAQQANLRSRIADSSAAERVTDRRADPLHGVAAKCPTRPVSDPCSTVWRPSQLIDDRQPVQPDLAVVDVDVFSQTTDGGSDLGERHEAASIEHLGSGQRQDRPPLPTNFGQPDFAASRGSPQPWDAVQKVSALSGRLGKASRPARAWAACTASVTPRRAAAEVLTLSCRTRPANSPSSVKVVLDEATSVREGPKAFSHGRVEMPPDLPTGTRWRRHSTSKVRGRSLHVPCQLPRAAGGVHHPLVARTSGRPPGQVHHNIKLPVRCR